VQVFCMPGIFGGLACKVAWKNTSASSGHNLLQVQC
jgi:hypothetical protein